MAAGTWMSAGAVRFVSHPRYVATETPISRRHLPLLQAAAPAPCTEGGAERPLRHSDPLISAERRSTDQKRQVAKWHRRNAAAIWPTASNGRPRWLEFAAIKSKIITRPLSRGANQYARHLSTQGIVYAIRIDHPSASTKNRSASAQAREVLRLRST